MGNKLDKEVEDAQAAAALAQSDAHSPLPASRRNILAAIVMADVPCC